jgi:D-amino peptidase
MGPPPFASGAVNVLTKESISRFSSKNLRPTEPCALIRAGDGEAVRILAAGNAPSRGITRPVVLNLELQTGDVAEVAS